MARDSRQTLAAMQLFQIPDPRSQIPDQPSGPLLVRVSLSDTPVDHNSGDPRSRPKRKITHALRHAGLVSCMVSYASLYVQVWRRCPSSFPVFLIDLLLLVHAQLAGAHVDQQQKTAHDGEDLEEIVLGEVLVRMVLVKLRCPKASVTAIRAENRVNAMVRRLTVQKLLTSTLKTLSRTTRMTALSLALNPTTTITHATNPIKLTRTLQMLQSPAKTKPMKRKMSKTRPPSWMYIFLSFSSIVGSPANTLLFFTKLSPRTMRRPPMTDRLRRKKFRSKMRP